MKKNLIVMSMALALGLSAQNGMADETGAGCGIGKMVMEGKSGKGANIAAAIINVVLIPNTFFMSTAASMGEEMLGCDPTKTVLKEQQKEEYLAANMDNLSRDMAQGGGSHLEVLANIMGIAEEDRPSFYSMTQQELAGLDLSGSASSVVSGLNVAMLDYPELAKYAR